MTGARTSGCLRGLTAPRPKPSTLRQVPLHQSRRLISCGLFPLKGKGSADTLVPRAEGTTGHREKQPGKQTLEERNQQPSPTTCTEKAELMDPAEPKLKKDTVKTSREERQVGGKRTEKLPLETERKKQTHEWALITSGIIPILNFRKIKQTVQF